METLQIKDKKFAVSIPEAEILEQVRRVAGEINRDFAGREPVFLAVLNGSFVFAADLLREVKLPSQISFIKLASYEGTASSGAVKELVGLNTDIAGRDVIIVEDIVDTGNTIVSLKQILADAGACESRVCTLLFKPDSYKKDIPLDYVAIQIPNDFIVGFGLDYNEIGRNLKDIYVLDE